MSTQNDDFTFDMDFEGDDIDKDGTGGMLPEGGYEFVLVDIEPHTENSGDMLVKLEVTAGTQPNQKGRTHHEYFKYPETGLSDNANGVRRSIFRQLFYALGLATKEQLKANPKLRVNLVEAIGRRCCGIIKHEKYPKADGSEGTKATLFTKGHWDLWHPSDPKAEGIPREAGGTGGGEKKEENAAAAGVFDNVDDLL
ncbi:MAG: hypothetical protein ABFD92_21550 [Planctomycetaceae bacterium]